MISFKLPYPPTINHYYGQHGTRKYIKQAGIYFRTDVKKIVGIMKPLECDIHLRIFVYVPDKRKRDLDNILKATQDALTHAGIWVDDSQITHLEVIKKTMINGGMIIVEIKPNETNAIQAQD